MATNYPKEITQCGMCLEEWWEKEDVRELNCGHSFCMDCLIENQQLNKKTACPICRTDHGIISDFKALSITYAKPKEHPPKSDELKLCGASKCSEEAAAFCVNCDQLLCKTHEELIHSLMATHKIMTVTEYEIQKQLAKFRLCAEHENQPITVACNKCFAVKCDLCDQLGESCSTSNENHVLGSISQVAITVKSQVRGRLDTIEASEEKSMKELKETLKSADASLEINRRSLDQINEAAEALKAKVENRAEELRQAVEASSKHIADHMESAQQRFGRLSKNNASLTAEASKLLTSDEVVLVQKRSELMNLTMEALTCPTNHAMPAALELYHSEMLRPIFPISLEQKSQLPASSIKDGTGSKPDQERLSESGPTTLGKFLNDIQTDPPVNFTHHSDTKFPSVIFTVCHLSSGELVVGGERSLVKVYGCEIPFVSKWKNRHQRSISSVFQAGTSLYVLSSHKVHEKDLHILHGVHNWVEDFVIGFNCPGFVQLAADEEHIMIVDCTEKCVRVYSERSLELLFIMRKVTHGRPWGIVAMPDGTVVISDKTDGLLVNLTVESNPRIIWTCGGLQQPTGLTLDTKSSAILVGSFSGQCVYVISYEGKLIRKINLMRCSPSVYDISTDGDHLAVAGGSNNVECYLIDRE